MRLSLPFGKQQGSRPNRKVRQRRIEGETKRAGGSPTSGRPSRTAKAHGRVQGDSLRTALRRVGAALWPERFPDVIAKLEEHRKVNRPAPRGFLWVWGLAVGLAAAAFIMHLHVRFDIIQTGYSLSRAQTEQRSQRLTQRELRLELATLKEPGRIEAQARTDLGMVRPEHERIIRLDRNGRSRRSSRRRASR